jgi:hypothetical protein
LKTEGRPFLVSEAELEVSSRGVIQKIRGGEQAAFKHNKQKYTQSFSVPGTITSAILCFSSFSDKSGRKSGSLDNFDTFATIGSMVQVR